MVAFLVGAIAAGVIIRNRERIFVDTERRAAAAEADRARRSRACRRSGTQPDRPRDARRGGPRHERRRGAGRRRAGDRPRRSRTRRPRCSPRIEAVGRESLTELRRMLGVLRDDRRRGRLAVAAAGHRRHRRRGRRSRRRPAWRPSWSSRDRQRALAPGIELAAFRIVQEALTNVRKHAGRSASATVRIVVRADARSWSRSPTTGVARPPRCRGSGAGHGLIGMRERVEIYGGEFTAGPRRRRRVRRPGRPAGRIADADTLRRPTGDRRAHHDHQGRDRRRPGADARRLHA